MSAPSRKETPTPMPRRPSSGFHGRVAPGEWEEQVKSLDRLAALAETELLDTEPDDAFDRFTRLASRIFQTPMAMVTLVDDHRQFFKSAVGLREPLACSRETPLSHSFCKHVVATSATLVVNDARKHPFLHTNPAIDEIGVVAYLGAPLITNDGSALGSLCVIDSTPRTWSEGDVTALSDLAAAVVAEIELRMKLRALVCARALLELHAEEIRILSLRDELTGLYNRRGFLEVARQQMKLVERARGSLALFFADLDGMKLINDHLGHEQGDRALVDTADVLRAVFRSSDVIARLGGDEFVVLAQAPPEGVDRIRARLRHAIDKRNVELGRPYRLALSIGVTTCDPMRRGSLEAVLAEADARMYEQKRQRRSYGSSPFVRERLPD